VDGLLEGVEGDQPEGRPEGAIAIFPCALLVGEELGQGLEGQLPQPLALGHEPFLEHRAAEGEAGQEVTLVEIDSLGQRVRVTGPRQSLEGHGIDIDRVRIEGNGVSGESQARRVGGGKGSAKSKQGFAQAVARSRLRAVAPEKHGQLVARVGLPGGHRQVCEQRLGLPRPEPQGMSWSEPGLEVAQEREAESHHARAR
jgi:hypothetical protein